MLLIVPTNKELCEAAQHAALLAYFTTAIHHIHLYSNLEPFQIEDSLLGWSHLEI